MHEKFTIEDTKAETFRFPFPAENAEVAMRLLAEPVNDPSHAWGKHPQDYHLWKTGTWDESTGDETVFPRKEHICCLVDLARLTPELRSLPIVEKFNETAAAQQGEIAKALNLQGGS